MQLLGDGAGGLPAVPGNHHRTDAGPAALGHRLIGLLARRVDHAGKAAENKVLLGGVPAPGNPPPAQRQHPHGVLRHLVVALQDALALRLGQGRCRPVFLHKGAALQQNVRRALGEHQQLAALGAHDDRHHLALGVEGQLPQQGVAAGGALHPALDGHHCQGRLGRLPVHRVGLLALQPPAGGVFDAGIVADGGDFQRALQVAVVLCTHRPAALLNPPGLQPVPGHRKVASGAADPLDGHPVFGEGSGLVRADDVGAAERLHRVQAADDRILLDHPVDRQRQSDGDDGGQALRDGGHRQRDAGDEHIQHRLSPQDAGPGHHRADQQAADGDGAAQLVQLFLQRRLLVVDRIEHHRDLSHAGVLPDGVDHRFAVPPGDDGSHEGADRVGHIVGAVVGVGFFHRHRLAGQQRLVKEQRLIFEDAAVRRDAVAGLEQHKVADGHLSGRDHLIVAVADDRGGGGGQLV